MTDQRLPVYAILSHGLIHIIDYGTLYYFITLLLSYARSAYLGEVIDDWTKRRIESVALADDLSQRITALLG